MADESPVQNLCDETTCPICLEYFKDPVIIDCGHNFCQACITQCWGKPDREASCPQCRELCPQRDFKPNRQLASIVQIAKKFCLQRTRGAEALGRVCERHQEPLKLFCEDDQALICVVCDKSKEHREHKVVPKDEAFKEYKKKIWNYLTFLKEKREEILSCKQRKENESQMLLEEAEIETQKIMAEFNQLHTFLEEQECLVLTKRKDLSDEIKDIRNKNIEKLSKEISSMDNLIKEMEEKHNQPASEFLQDIKSYMKMCNNQKCVTPQTSFYYLQKKHVGDFSATHSFLETTIKEFKETMLSGLQEKKVYDLQRVIRDEAFRSAAAARPPSLRRAKESTKNCETQ